MTSATAKVRAGRTVACAALLLAAATAPGCTCTSFRNNFEDDYGCTTDDDCNPGRICEMRSDRAGGLCVVGSRADSGTDTGADAGPDAGTDTGTDAGTDAGNCGDCSALDDACNVGTCDAPSATCVPAPRVNGTVCRAPADLCDAPETCTGGVCAADVLAIAGTACRPAAGGCDVAETCTGGSAACPADAFVSGATVCRVSAGACDPAEACSGTAGACPADGFEPASVPCRLAADLCDVDEFCTGVGAACPADDLVGAGTTCRASTGPCDAGEACTGASAACPSDALSGAGTPCRTAVGLCDVTENCTGVDGTCPVDALLGAGTPCRTAAGTCDLAENCTGSGTACPIDLFVTGGTLCRSATDVCDLDEACTGTAAACPTNLFEPASTECRGAAGMCDAAENCTGSAAACPIDLLAPDGSPCDDTIACTTMETCDAGVCQGAVEDDALCLVLGDVCRVACFGGCGTPPTADLFCASPTALVSGSGTSACALDLGGLTGQLACLSCSATGANEALGYADFTGCALDGWASTGGALDCPTTLGTPRDAIEAGNDTVTLEQTFDATGLDDVWLCFDYADAGATSNELLTVEFDGGTCAATFTALADAGGPFIGGTNDGVYFSYCVDLDAVDACAANNASLHVTFTLDSQDAGDLMAIDQVWVGGADSACVSLSAAASQGIWSCSSGVTGWIVEAGTPTCNTTPNELRADNESWQMRRCVDLSAVSTDVFVSFVYGETNADEGGGAEGIELFYNPACDGACTCPAGSWVRFFAHQSDLGTDPSRRTWLTNLSALDPAVDSNPSVGVRVLAYSGAAGRIVHFDDFTAGGIDMTCAATALSLTSLVEVGGGLYTLSATSTAAQNVQLSCSWDSPAVPIDDTASIVYLP